MSPEKRSAIAAAAVGAVLADGRATADEVRFLDRLHRTLQLPPESVHAALHQQAVARDETVTIAAEDLPPDLPLPSVNTSAVSGAGTLGIQLDRARLARIQAETSSVSALLADVFTDEESVAARPSPPPAPEASNAETSHYQDLDVRHGRLLAFVVGRKGRVPLESFEAESRVLRLLPGAAMETINDWSFANHEEAVLEEDGDEVIVPDHLLPVLTPN
jgi:hypothetical protein